MPDYVQSNRLYIDMLYAILFAATAATLQGCLDPEAPGNLVPGTVDDDPNLPFS